MPARSFDLGFVASHSGDGDVDISPPTPGTLPVTVNSRATGLELAEWLTENSGLVDDVLAHVGAVLLRGFGIASAADLRRTIAEAGFGLLEYRHRSTPRNDEYQQVYTSTEYPPEYEILLHNENSYAHAWPLRLWFCCLEPARAGGQTPLADSRKVLSRIAPSLRDELDEIGVLYVRNYHGYIDLPWQEVFQTDDPNEVDRQCRDSETEAIWHDGALTTREVRQAVATHPRTGDTVWFNQAHLFHASSLPDPVHDALQSILSESEFPRMAFKGSGAPFRGDELEDIKRAYLAETTQFDWQRGDVLLLDNMLIAHGRRSFSPPRKLLVAMSDLVRGQSRARPDVVPDSR